METEQPMVQDPPEEHVIQDIAPNTESSQQLLEEKEVGLVELSPTVLPTEFEDVPNSAFNQDKAGSSGSTKKRGTLKRIFSGKAKSKSLEAEQTERTETIESKDTLSAEQNKQKKISKMLHRVQSRASKVLDSLKAPFKEREVAAPEESCEAAGEGPDAGHERPKGGTLKRIASGLSGMVSKSSTKIETSPRASTHDLT